MSPDRAAEYGDRNVSWIACERCQRVFNSDDDPDCFLFGEDALLSGPEKRKWDAVLCERCRDEMDDQ